MRRRKHRIRTPGVQKFFFPKTALPQVRDALRPGGLLLIDDFHKDTARFRPLGGGLSDRELFRLLQEYRILLYEDVEHRQDWGLPFGATNRLVRVLAQKPAPLPPGCSWEGREYPAGSCVYRSAVADQGGVTPLIRA